MGKQKEGVKNEPTVGGMDSSRESCAYLEKGRTDRNAVPMRHTVHWT